MKNITIIGHKNEKDLNLTQRAAKKACRRISQFLKLEIPKSTIKLTYSRKELDKKMGHKTEPWIIALADLEKNEITIFAPSIYSKEGIYPIDRFPSTVCHEMTHIAIYAFVKGRSVPVWLNEGLPYVVANQTDPEQTFFIPEQGICKALDSPKNWRQNIRGVGQNLVGRFVKFLIDSYSLTKLMKLLKDLEPNYQYVHFAEIFKKIYDKTITEVEKEFLDEINNP
ncbi:hypothetical protein KKB83_04355 [Patescibacteria group bacterium]|nr:hypothetical protein [Patescibacteria group bacterium]